MSELPSETNPQILVNGEQQHQGTGAATVEEQLSLDGDCSEDSAAAEKETQVKMQSVLQQVRKQIRSQVGTKAPKSRIMELVQIVRDREIELAQVDGEPEGKAVNGEEKREAEVATDESKDDMDLKEEVLCAVFEEKLEANKKALRDEFEEQISQVRKEMQAYTDKALKDLECKMSIWRSDILQQTHPKEQPDKKQKPPTAPSLASRRGRVLTRTMTTIIPKTCAPVIIGPRAKSETLTSSKGRCSQLLPRDPVVSIPGNRPYQSRKPLPPACPPLHQRKKPVRANAKTGN
ncbi:uncharacterized protein AKAME5_002421900 [Lates japonicus]|uniref:Uncharacterized protein n=1 Tax=Lates japonicus TaxID=270547 RepID=A0AAD3NIY8_LATJO|nr:uncharacterized protein AKAME5_002421900 [Lates japonicus]